MQVQSFFDTRSSTLSYVAFDSEEQIGVVIDPVLDFDAPSGRVWSESAEKVAAFIDRRKLSIPYVLDTHAHADHFSGMQFFRERYAARTVIGKHIGEVQTLFSEIYHLDPLGLSEGGCFDLLLEDGQGLDVGPFEIVALHTPGHTPACMSYRIEDALFVGDALFQPDYGTARCDFPGGSAARLYESIERLYALPEATRTFTCHDYQPGGRELRFESTIGEHKRANVQLRASTTQSEYIRFRKERDATLAMPELMLASIQVNIRAGRLPEPESNGRAYLKLPINAFETEAPGRSLIMGFVGLLLSVLVGVALGFFGGGGSILTVPLLVYVFGLEAKQAIASSLLIVAFASLLGAVQHYRAGNLRLRVGLVFGAAGMAGAYLGGRLGAFIDGGLLLLLFASVMVLASIAMWRARVQVAGKDREALATAKLLLEGFAVGIFTGLVGAGGGFLIVPALALWAGLPIRAAVGTSLFVIVLKSTAGFLGYASHVSVDPQLVASVSACAIVGSLAGSQLAHRVDPQSLRKAFAGFVLAMAGVILLRESATLVAMAGEALPTTLPQLLFALVVLAFGIVAGRATRRGPSEPIGDAFKEGAGI